MPHLLRIPGFTGIFFILSGTLLTAQSGNTLEALSDRLHNPDGVEITCTVNQFQYGEVYAEDATVEILDEYRFLLMSSSQTVKVDGNDIYTFTPANQQVVIDCYDPGEFTVFTLLTGQFDRVDVLEESHPFLSRESKIEYEVPDFGVSGSIVLENATTTPKTLTIRYDLENYVSIDINTFTVLSESPEYSSWTVDGWEVIDLRE